MIQDRSRGRDSPPHETQRVVLLLIQYVFSFFVHFPRKDKLLRIGPYLSKMHRQQIYRIVTWGPRVYQSRNQFLRTLSTNPSTDAVTTADAVTDSVTTADSICTICCEPCLLSSSVTLRQLDCHHIFHRKCIDAWLNRSMTMNCPNCRQFFLCRSMTATTLHSET
jgi:hypothetical protein